MGTGGYQLCPQDFTLQIRRDERKLMDVRHGHQSCLTALGRSVLPGEWGRVMGLERSSPHPSPPPHPLRRSGPSQPGPLSPGPHLPGPGSRPLPPGQLQRPRCAAGDHHTPLSRRVSSDMCTWEETKMQAQGIRSWWGRCPPG